MDDPFLADEWFIENLAFKYRMRVARNRSNWLFTQPDSRKVYRPRLAGFVKSFEYVNGTQQMKFDLLTVKGSGHFVPLNRPGPALQMIYNFIQNKAYSESLPDIVSPKPFIMKPNVPAPRKNFIIGTKIGSTSVCTVLWEIKF